jgi:hypothetical protein
MRPRQHIDGVDLQQTEAIDGALEVAEVGRLVWSCNAEALRGKRDVASG